MACVVAACFLVFCGLFKNSSSETADAVLKQVNETAGAEGNPANELTLSDKVIGHLCEYFREKLIAAIRSRASKRQVEVS